MSVSEQVQIQLIISIASIVGIVLTGWFALKAKEHSKRVAEAATQATEDASVVRASLTTNNGGSHLKDWLDDLREDVRGLRRDVSGLHERLTASERERAKNELDCRTGLQRQIDAARHERWRESGDDRKAS